MDDIANANANIRNSATQLAASQINSYDLIESVIGFVDTEVHEDAKVFLDILINRSPELVFLGLVEIEVSIVLTVSYDYTFSPTPCYVYSHCVIVSTKT